MYDFQMLVQTGKKKEKKKAFALHVKLAATKCNFHGCYFNWLKILSEVIHVKKKNTALKNKRDQGHAGSFACIRAQVCCYKTSTERLKWKYQCNLWFYPVCILFTWTDRESLEQPLNKLKHAVTYIQVFDNNNPASVNQLGCGAEHK